MGRFKLYIPLLIFAVLAAVLFGSLHRDPHYLPSARIGKEFPTFSLPSLDKPGRTIERAALIGKPALVNVWATWCPTCRAEQDELLKIAATGVPIYGVNYKDDRSDAEKWLRNLGNPYRFVIFDAKGSLGLDLGVYGAPETYVIDAKGVIRYRRVGAVDQRVWNEKLKPLLESLKEKG